MLAWILCGIFGMTAAVLALHLIGVRRDLYALSTQLADRLESDTNNVLYVSGGDRAVRRLAAELNTRLRRLRALQLEYISGDRKLREAVTSISHDLRTPLTAISGYLELLSDAPLSADVRRQLDVIASRTAQMQQLTEELFRYALILSDGDPSGETETVCVNALLEESIAGYYAALTKRGIEPEITLPQERVYTVCSRSALARVFANLLNNALKYSSGDLRITMTTEGVIRFVNHAPGLRETDTQKLFERFFTVESAQHSTGLGLAIARTVTGQMGGSIDADFADDCLTITLQLPVSGI